MGDNFDAARNGQRVTALANDCGELAAPVWKAGQMLVALAKAHGGLVNAYWADMADECPVEVRLIEKRGLRRR